MPDATSPAAVNSAPPIALISSNESSRTICLQAHQPVAGNRITQRLHFGRQAHPSPRSVVLAACCVSIVHIVKTWCCKINMLARRVSGIHQFAEYHSAGEIRSLGRPGVVDFARLVLSIHAPQSQVATCSTPNNREGCLAAAHEQYACSALEKYSDASLGCRCAYCRSSTQSSGLLFQGAV